MATKSNKDLLIEYIKNRVVDIPECMTVDELTSYFQGYAKCQEDILKLIEKFAVPQT